MFIKHISCSICHSSDANALYDDGGTFCFSCHKAGKADNPKEKKVIMSNLSDRCLNNDTLRTYNIFENKDTGVVSFIYPNQKEKRRTLDKGFSWPHGKGEGLFGMNIFPSGGKVVCVTEGEYDAAASYQMLGAKIPCVSVRNGAGSAIKDCQEAFEWLDSFDSIVIAFDGDEPGQKATEEVAALFGSKAKVIKHSQGFKDANEYLMKQSSAKYVNAFVHAEGYRPEGIVSVGDIKERLLAPQKKGIPWCFDTLTQLTHGRREGELYGFGAGVGVGKTDVFTQSIAYDIAALGEPVGVIYLEQPVTETVARVCGKLDGKLYHIPGANYTREEYVGSIESLETSGKLWLFEHFGSKEWDTIKAKIRYMKKALGIRMVYLDHLTALTADAEDERRSLDRLMADMASLAQADGLIIHFISHLSTPADGKSHEEGARVRERDFTGSRSIARWSHYMFGLERDKQAEDPVVRSTTTFRVLKDRYTGQATGEVFFLRYDAASGKLFESAKPPEEVL
jgi:twinkle protein